MTEKKLSDYLHFYLPYGIRVYVFPLETITNGFLEKYRKDFPDGVYNPVLTFGNYHRFIADGYKPFFRRLSSMTGPEAVEIYNELYPGIDQPDDRKASIIKSQLDYRGMYWEGSVSIQDYVAWFPVLIKRGYWLWDESWFTEGLIIDADTVK